MFLSRVRALPTFLESKLELSTSRRVSTGSVPKAREPLSAPALGLKMASISEEYDFVELRVYDIHGNARGRMVTRSAVTDVMKKGIGLSGSFRFLGVKGQSSIHLKPPDYVLTKYYRLMPHLETLKPYQPYHRDASSHKKIAAVLCELRCLDGTLETGMPREATLALLQQLQEEFGLTIRSTFEVEFGIRHAKTAKTFAHEAKFASTAVLHNEGDILFDFVETMQGIDVKIDTLLAEYGSGQFEVTCHITEGIEACDMIAEFKTASHIYLKRKGLDVVFMTCVEPQIGCSNGFHFNFSIWNSEGRNIFADPDDPETLSEFGRYWLAGMVHHSPAMLALSSPTINCYRRVGFYAGPMFANWSLDRKGSFCLKVEAGGNVYIENRLPSSACNPYLVLASTLAAGMDGVRRKLELPPPGDESTRLPATLEEAVDALEADTSLTEALGEGVMQMFIYTKRTFELDEFKAFGQLSDEEMLLKEKEYYYHPL
ncbi:hypothetical protein RRG08_004035 [Elysia crispata]|uniref:Lengsin n=1 Tax=Elysia crispata TaxID=231223 RepID=A0AAE1ALL0_9GAST|nr:hypothetical protein RRG08_004035 [Elysia crispata]